jgi:hypothetical protein
VSQPLFSFSHTVLSLSLLRWLTCIGVLIGWKHHVVFLAIALFLKWLGLLYFLQAFSSTGPLVRMVFQIIVDMRYFMLILLVAVLASASSFYALLHHARPLHSGDDDDDDNGSSPSPFRGAGQTLFFMFKMLLLGDFDTNLFLLGDYVALLQVLFVSSMMLTLIILLNLLIALMSDSYERIQVTLSSLLLLSFFPLTSLFFLCWCGVVLLCRTKRKSSS